MTIQHLRIRHPARDENFASVFRNSVFIIASSRLDKRGVRPIVTEREAGCDGRNSCARRAWPARTVKPCGPVPPTLGSSCAEQSAQRRRLESPVLRGERGAAVKPLRRECRMFRLTCTDLWAPFLFSPRGLRVRPAPGIPCALYLRRDENEASPGRKLRRGNAEVCLKLHRHSGARPLGASPESILTMVVMDSGPAASAYALRASADRSRRPGMTKEKAGLLRRFAPRNDGVGCLTCESRKWVGRAHAAVRAFHPRCIMKLSSRSRNTV
jgi:hypothetical protein